MSIEDANAMAIERDREDTVADISRDGKSKVHERLLGTLNACFKASTLTLAGGNASDSIRAKPGEIGSARRAFCDVLHLI